MTPGRQQVPHHQDPVGIRRAVGALVPRGAPARRWLRSWPTRSVAGSWCARRGTRA